MSRKRVPPSWFRRLISPVREFLRTDVDMTERAMMRAPAALRGFLCAPSLFGIWLLDELAREADDLKSLFTALLRSGSRSAPPSEPGD